MFQLVIQASMMLACGLLFGPVSAQEPTIDQIYTMAQSNLAEAQAAVAGVLRTHPNSAKAHFVNAELLTRQGKIADADIELRAAERLEPGLPFTSPQAVQELQRRIATPRGAVSGVSPVGVAPYGSRVAPPTTGGGVPWALLLLVAAVALVIYLVFQFMRRRSSGISPGPTSAYGAAPPQPPGLAPQAPMGGMGSGILGGLATGAAVGAGIVAGEALAHRFTEGHHDTAASSSGVAAETPPAADSMGGNDFGIADSSSWDDNLGGGGGSDWS